MTRVLLDTKVDMGDPVENERRRRSPQVIDAGNIETSRILQFDMPHKKEDVGRFAVAYKNSSDGMRHWYFLNSDPSGTCWGNGWDEAGTLSDCFTLLDSLTCAKDHILSYLKETQRMQTDLIGIFKVEQKNDDTLILTHIESNELSWPEESDKLS
ncbi:hypothetical protein [Idiomarina abyssalis]|uniref:Uncharacterized protein n=1 Tax=Idiomarina abyssalis TaxID=86102 RepID=A0A8I1GDN9_9GAMM|nr:hypothetical protein [Idiomarina abyssalis]MBJ7265454.1 hypothetical protein [Idiomarina abyssalis]MBJ7316872.1 hypothetical protein [Idiomarina abyssalis]